MLRTWGYRPCRGLRYCKARRLIHSRAVKSQLHGGRIGTETCVTDNTWNDLGLQASLQHLKPRPQKTPHVLSVQHATCAQPSNPDQDHRRVHKRLSSPTSANRGCNCELSNPGSSGPARGVSRVRGELRVPSLPSSRDAAALTRRLTSCCSVAELQRVVNHYRSQFNHIHVAAAIVTLAKITNTRSSAVAQNEPQSKDLEPTVAYTAASGQLRTASRDVVTETAQAGSPIGPATGAACTVAGAAGPGLLTIRCRNLKRPQRHLSETHSRSSSDSQSSDNTQGSYHGTVALSRPCKRRRHTVHKHPAMSSPPPHLPVAAVSVAASRLLSDLLLDFLAQLHYCDSARQLANVIWALGAMGCRDQLQLPAAAEKELLAGGGAKIAAALPQELSNLALGLAKLGYQEFPLWTAIIAASKERLSAFKPQELHNLAWAVATARQDRSMVCAVVQSALPQLSAFSPSGLANLMWVCATVQYPCQELFDAAAAVLLTVPAGCLNGQDVANTVWAHARVGYRQPALVARLAGWVLVGGQRALSTVRTQELVNMIWAFSVQLPPSSTAPQPGPPSSSLPWRPAGAAAGAWQLAGTGREQEEKIHEPQKQHELGDTAMEGFQGDTMGSSCGGAGADGISGSAEEDSSGATWRGMKLRTSAGHGASGTVMERLATAPAGPCDPTPSGAVGAHDPLASVSESVIRGSYGCNKSGLAVNSGRSCSSNDVRCQDAPRATLDIAATSDSTPIPDKHSTSLLSQLLALLAFEAASRVDLTPQGAANALWACAQSKPSALPQEPLGALLAAAAARASSMDSHELCKTFWAAGKLRDAGHWLAEDVVAALVTGLRRPGMLEATAPVGLAQLVDGTVRLRLVQRGLLDELAKRLLGAAGCEAMGPQELCVVAAAVAEAVRSAKYCNPLLLNGLANAAAARVECMGPQGLSTLLCSYARANHYHGPLTTRICQLAVQRLRDFGNRELSNLVWGLAVLNMPDRELLERTAWLIVARLRAWRHRGVGAMRLQTRMMELEVMADAQEQGSMGMATGFSGDQEQRGGHASAGQTENGEEGTLSGQQMSRELTHRGPQQRQASMGTADRCSGIRQHTQCSGPARRDATGSGGSHPGRRPSSMPAHDQPSAVHLVRGATSDDGTIPTRNVEGSAASNKSAIAPSSVLVAAAAGPTHTQSSPLQLSSQPPQSQLRRLPLPHPIHPDAYTHVCLQAQRPSPRDACTDARTLGHRSDEAGCTFRTSSDAVGHSKSSSSWSLSDMSSFDFDCHLESDYGSRRDSSLTSTGSSELNPQAHAKSMAKLLWAYAKCELYVPALFRHVSTELTPLLHLLTPHEVTQVLWAVAVTGHDCQGLLAASTVTVTSRLAHFCAWDGSVLAWSYGKQRYTAARPLMETLQQHALRGAPYKGPALSRLAWACRQLEVRLEPALLERLVQRRRAEAADGAAVRKDTPGICQ